MRNEVIDLEELTEKISLKLDETEQRVLMEHLFDIAVADGIFTKQEEAFLRRLHLLLGTDKEHFERLVRLCRVSVGSLPREKPTYEQRSRQHSGTGRTNDEQKTTEDLSRLGVDYLYELLSPKRPNTGQK